ncbi:pentapeptide repeat-containing protein, partial [Candidatus Megaera venefica]
MEQIAMINCDFQSVTFDNSPVYNSQLRGINSVAMVIINSPFTRNILFNNKGFERISTSEAITNVNELIARKDLSNMNMAFLDLSGINSVQIVFKNTILRGAKLKDAKLKSCLFIDVDLSYSDLTNTDLSGSDIQGTGFLGAKLNHTNLSSTKLSNLDFSRSFVDSVVLNQARLENVKGLETKDNSKAQEVLSVDPSQAAALATKKSD